MDVTMKLEPKPTENIWYVAAVEVFDKFGNIKDTVFDYLHAKDYVEANWKYRTAHTKDLMSRKIRIVSIAPAVGFFVQDEHGEVLAG
jgi:hypothetical protein